MAGLQGLEGTRGSVVGRMRLHIDVSGAIIDHDSLVSGSNATDSGKSGKDAELHCESVELEKKLKVLSEVGG